MDWVRYWRADGLAVEAMHAHLTSHVYHRHSHETYSFGVTETGAQAFTCRNGRHVSAAGMVMTFNPDDPHDGHAATADGFTYWMAHVSPSVFGTRPLFREPVLTDPVLAGAVRGLCVALAGPAGALERYERLTTATRLLTARAGGRQEPEPGTVVADRIRSVLHDRAAEDVTAADLAAAAGCSRFAAYRAFTAAYGLAPSDYQRQLRLRTARRLLASGVSPARAAAEAGFADQAHLTRWFRRSYGVTPGVYQRS
ncbi:MAG TPA: AraC family ligand binding domain-containing protein [Streptosporangiaceae bacterium]|nr:AraC family ligand binding domain-containing protein [Streptosporangiaceae bacterium]